jgi:hypothetical protein
VATSLPVMQQAPGGGVDEQRRALAQVRIPLAVADLVADQRVARGLVGDAQQRLGQAHQRHAFLRRQRELLQQALHDARTPGAGLALAQRLGNAQGQLLGRRCLISGRRAWASSGARASGSGRRVAAVMAARSGLFSGVRGAKSANGAEGRAAGCVMAVSFGGVVGQMWVWRVTGDDPWTCDE